MKSTNYIGLDQNRATELTGLLNTLLANYQIIYQNIRGAHWNVKGSAFFELHQQFETMYLTAAEVIDGIAERILTLGGTPMHRFQDYLANASIKESPTQTSGKELVETIMNDFQQIIELERQALEAAGESNDEGTVTLLSDDITALEKQQWMLNAYLGN